MDQQCLEISRTLCTKLHIMDLLGKLGIKKDRKMVQRMEELQYDFGKLVDYFNLACKSLK